MIVKLGSKIRELRKAKNISQEVLAEFLGVSFQAVSKWENDTAMPDVALIPVIANYFRVSIDELFDYNRLEAEEKITEIWHRAADLRLDDPKAAEKILRDGLKEFPGNDILLNNLLYTMRTPERAEEVISICKQLIESTREDDVRFDALRILAETYHDQGKQDLVVLTLEKIPEIYFTKLELVAELTEGEISLQAARGQAGLNIDSTALMLEIIAKRLGEQGKHTEAEKYIRMEKGILEVLRKEDPERFAESDFYEEARERLARLEAEG